jgi:hypothetical protein
MMPVERTVLSAAILLGLAAVLLFLVTEPVVAEDEIKILDGGTVRGYIIEENIDYVLIRRTSGDIQEIARDDIERIEHGPAFADEFKTRWEGIPDKDADAFFELGLWCEDRGRSEEATKCFSQVIKINPDHQIAREKLGHMYYDGKWYENIDEYYTARGYVNFEGNWIPKEEKEKYEAGLVKLDDGTWVSKARLEEIEKVKSRTPPQQNPTEKKEPEKDDAKADKAKWTRQKRDDAFYEDMSGSVAWSQARTVPSKHYVIESNCSASHVKRYAEMLDLVYEKYVKVFGKPGSARSCHVRIYSSHQEFMQREGKPQGVGGFYGGGRVTAYHGKFGPTGSTQTVLFHECTHQFHDMVAGIRKSQIWFTEGLAVFFECSEVDENDRIHVGIVNKDRLGLVQKGVKEGNYINLETLLRTPQSSFGGAHYAYAWTVLYFLIYTNTNNRKVFNRYWSNVCCGSGESPGSPKFKEIIGIPLQDLEDCWKQWVQILDKDDLPEEVEAKSKEFFKNYKKS